MTTTVNFTAPVDPDARPSVDLSLSGGVDFHATPELTEPPALPARIGWVRVDLDPGLGVEAWRTLNPGWGATIFHDITVGKWTVMFTSASEHRTWSGQGFSHCQCWVRRQARKLTAI